MPSLFKRCSLALSILLATLLTAGSMMAVSFILGIGSFISSGWTQVSVSKQLVFTVEGEPLMSTYLPGNPAVTYRTLDGKSLEDPAAIKITAANGGTELPPSAPDRKEIPDWGFWTFRIIGILQTTPSMNFWYLVQDGGPSSSAYFVGYQPQAKQVIGYVGRRGFRSTLPPAEERIPVRGSFYTGTVAPLVGHYGTEPSISNKKLQSLFLVSDGALLKIDLSRQSVETLPMPDEVIGVGEYEHLTAVADDRNATYETRIVVRLPRELQVLTTEGKPIRSIPLQHSVRDQTLSLRGTTTEATILQARLTDESSAKF